MTQSNENNLHLRIRKNLLEALDLWTSKDKQIEYQVNVPVAQVSAELFCGWDDFYNPDNNDFKNAFNEKEKQILDSFNKILNEISKQTPKKLPYINEFVQTEEWHKINLAATDAMNKINSL